MVKKSFAERRKTFTTKYRGGKGVVENKNTPKMTPPKKDRSNKDKPTPRKPSKDLLEEAQKIDKETLSKGSAKTTGTSRSTTEFLEDLKEAYKAGLYSGGTKAKAFAKKYNLKPGELATLRLGIDQGLGQIIGKDRTNVLQEFVEGLRQEGILTTSGPSEKFLQQRASEIYEPEMTPYDREPITGLMGLSPLANIGIAGLDLIAGGSDKGMRGKYFAREQLGLEGEELDNFAAAVANDRDLYNQMMATPLMQNYELNEFRAEANKNAMARMRGGDPDPISGEQGGGEGDDGSDDGTTDPGTDPNYTPPPQNYYTFFDPNLGRYRSGTYDEYLQYVTAKDGGIIQLQQGGTDKDPIANAPGGVSPVLDPVPIDPQGRKLQLQNLFEARKEIQNLITKGQSEEEGKQMIMDDIDEKISNLSDKSKEGIMMAMTDQPAKDIFMANNPDIGPVLREDLGPLKRLGDTLLNKLLTEPLRRSDISTGSAIEYIDRALNNFVAKEIIPPNTTYDQLTDPFKELVFAEAERLLALDNAKDTPLEIYQTATNIANDPLSEDFTPIIKNSEGLSSEIIKKFLEDQKKDSEEMSGVTGRYDDKTNQIIPISDRRLVSPDTNDRIDDMIRDQYMNQLYQQALDYEMQKERDGGTTIRDPQTNQITAFNVADGGIIGLKDGGMNDMMQADSLMFRDPSDEGQWEYNV